jgi:hypothetical protein
MLLLLESRCLFGRPAYNDIVARILERYWSAEHQSWLPYFLINDLVRYWKTLCLNYEIRPKDDSRGRRHLDVLKLRYSRMWTCFSGLAYLLAGVEGSAIARTRVETMVSATPVERMLDIAERRASASAHVDELLHLYVAFLKLTSSIPKPELEQQLVDPEQWEAAKASSDEFGRAMHRLIADLTAGTAVERFLLI